MCLPKEVFDVFWQDRPFFVARIAKKCHFILLFMIRCEVAERFVIITHPRINKKRAEMVRGSESSLETCCEYSPRGRWEENYNYT